MERGGERMGVEYCSIPYYQERTEDYTYTIEKVINGGAVRMERMNQYEVFRGPYAVLR